MYFLTALFIFFNLQRRVRMILVEGKLRWWGRADLVIKLLDVDLPQAYPDTAPDEEPAYRYWR